MSREPVCILVPGEPVGKDRPRVAIRGKGASAYPQLYTDEKTAKYEQLIRLEAALSMRGATPISQPVLLELEMVFSIPASYTKTKRELALAGQLFPTKKPDIDNVIKAVCDAFNGIVWSDDVQVTDLIVRKRFGAEPYVQANVTPLNRLCSS